MEEEEEKEEGEGEYEKRRIMRERRGDRQLVERWGLRYYS